MSARSLLHRASSTAPFVLKPAILRAAVPSAARSLVTSAPASALTKVTTLSNGLTVATEASSSAQTTTVGAWVDAGSRSETDATGGAASFLEQLTFKGTAKRPQGALEAEVEKLGAQLNGYTSREQTVFYAQSLRQDLGKTVDIISDLLQNPTLEASALDQQREVLLKEQESVKPIEETVFDYLHAVAFQKQGLGRTVTGSEESLAKLSQKDLQAFKDNHYVSDRTVLVGTGGVDHDELVRLAEQHFRSLPSSPNPLSVSNGPAPQFVGSDVRIRDDAHPTANFAIAVEGASYTSPDYIPLQVLQAILGNWDRSLGASTLLGSRLSFKVADNELANSFTHFSTSYSDTGLWGVYVVSENTGGLDDTVHFILKEWQRQSMAPTSVETERAKAQLKAALAFGLDSPTALADDIGRQISATGKRLSIEEVSAQIDAVTPADIKRVALTYLWDRDIAIAAYGRIEGLLPYDRIRADMSSMAY